MLCLFKPRPALSDANDHLSAAGVTFVALGVGELWLAGVFRVARVQERAENERIMCVSAPVSVRPPAATSVPVLAPTWVRSRFQSSRSFPFAHICFRLRIFVNLIDRCRYRYFTFGGSVLLFVSIVLQTLHVWCVFACTMCTFFMGSV